MEEREYTWTPRCKKCGRFASKEEEKCSNCGGKEFNEQPHYPRFPSKDLLEVNKENSD